MEEGWKFESLKVESMKAESTKALPKNGAYSNSIYYKDHFWAVLSCFHAFRFHAFHFQAFKLPTLLHYLILMFEQTNQIIVILYFKHSYYLATHSFASVHSFRHILYFNLFSESRVFNYETPQNFALSPIIFYTESLIPSQ